MDADRFDSLTVAFSTHRRTMLRGLVAGVTATLLGRGEPAGAGIPVCGGEAAKCKKRYQCCSGECKKKKGKKKGKCACADGQYFCATDACCPIGDTCVDDACAGACQAGAGSDFCAASANFCGFSPASSPFTPLLPCFCATSQDGAVVCIGNEVVCQVCDSDDDCDGTSVCITFTGPHCPGCEGISTTACAPLCPNAPTAEQSDVTLATRH